MICFLGSQFEKKLGKVAKVVGLTIESIGPSAKLNDHVPYCHKGYKSGD